MSSAEHMVHDLGMQPRGIHVLSWDNKIDLVRTLLVLRNALPAFPESLTVMPTNETDLQRFGLKLYGAGDEPATTSMRVLLIPQASTQTIGAWLNGWRSRLAAQPGTLIVIRHADLISLNKRAPDLISFVQSEIYEVTGLLPLATKETVERMSAEIPDGWLKPLESLPGTMPSKDELGIWLASLRANL